MFFQDIARVEASIGQFSKQMEVYRIDKERWSSRFKVSRAQLTEIQKEINNMVFNFVLQILLLIYNEFNNMAE